MHRIYLDYAAATPIDSRVKAEMEKVEAIAFGNPGGLHREAAAAKDLLEKARADAAKALGAYPDEIVFTSGGTEANNLAVFGTVEAAKEKSVQKGVREPLHAVTSQIEHSSIRQPMLQLERQDVSVSWTGVDSDGLIDLKQFKELLSDTTAFVSVIHANNEIGTIQPIDDIAKAVRMHRKRSRKNPHDPGAGHPHSVFPAEDDTEAVRPIVHTDAAQSPLYTDLDLGRLGVDLATIDSGKIYGPRGIGMLYVRRGTELSPLLYGGRQERGWRPGTENAVLAAGFAKALGIAREERVGESERLSTLRDKLLSGIQEIVPDVTVNGSMESRLPNNVNVSILGVDTEFLVITLDELGVACATKSACLENDERGSYVVSALPGHEAQAKNTLRLSLGRFTTEKDVEIVQEKIRQALALCRSGF